MSYSETKLSMCITETLQLSLFVAPFAISWELKVRFQLKAYFKVWRWKETLKLLWWEIQKLNKMSQWEQYAGGSSHDGRKWLIPMGDRFRPLRIGDLIPFSKMPYKWGVILTTLRYLGAHPPPSMLFRPIWGNSLVLFWWSCSPSEPSPTTSLGASPSAQKSSPHKKKAWINWLPFDLVNTLW